MSQKIFMLMVTIDGVESPYFAVGRTIGDAIKQAREDLEVVTDKALMAFLMAI